MLFHLCESRMRSFRILLTPLTYVPVGDPLLQGGDLCQLRFNPVGGLIQQLLRGFTGR